MHVVIEADELAAQLRGDDPPVVADVRWTLGGASRYSDYVAGHIPSAQFVDLDTELAAPNSSQGGTGGRHPLPDPADFQQAMRRIGLSGQRPLVIYDDATALASARLWWMLVDAGKQDVHVLNGGYRAWLDGGYPTEAGEDRPVSPGDFDAQPGQLPAVDGDQLARLVADDRAPAIIDVRAPERYAGSTEPMDAVSGHIPGAVNVPSMTNVDQDGRFKDPGEIAERYRGTGTGDQHPVVYCGSGITAAHTALSRAVAGLPLPTLYPGSWSDWSSDPGRPVRTGNQP